MVLGDERKRTHVVDEWSNEWESKETEDIRFIQPYHAGTHSVDWLLKYKYPKKFGVLCTIYNNAKKILCKKFLLLITEFWTVIP